MLSVRGVNYNFSYRHNNQPTVNSKNISFGKVIDIEIDPKTGIRKSMTESSEDGRELIKRILNPIGKTDKKIVTRSNADGAKISDIEYVLNDDGKYESITRYDANGKKTSSTTYTYNNGVNDRNGYKKYTKRYNANGEMVASSEHAYDSCRWITNSVITRNGQRKTRTYTYLGPERLTYIMEDGPNGRVQSLPSFNYRVYLDKKMETTNSSTIIPQPFKIIDNGYLPQGGKYLTVKNNGDRLDRTIFYYCANIRCELESIERKILRGRETKITSSYDSNGVKTLERIIEPAYPDMYWTTKYYEGGLISRVEFEKEVEGLLSPIHTDYYTYTKNGKLTIKRKSANYKTDDIVFEYINGQKISEAKLDKEGKILHKTIFNKAGEPIADINGRTMRDLKRNIEYKYWEQRLTKTVFDHRRKSFQVEYENGKVTSQSIYEYLKDINAKICRTFDKDGKMLSIEVKQDNSTYSTEYIYDKKTGMAESVRHSGIGLEAKITEQPETLQEYRIRKSKEAAEAAEKAKAAAEKAKAAKRAEEAARLAESKTFRGRLRKVSGSIKKRLPKNTIKKFFLGLIKHLKR